MPTESEAKTDLANNKKVFIVRGHDDHMKLQVAWFIKKLGLDAIILSEMPNEGKAIIEKFEKYSDVGYAVVLLTPDDEMKDEKTRARQNVILELGYFYGKLGRNRVTALYKRGTEIPSDILGVLYIPFEGDKWHLDLAKEMKEAGLPIDLNKMI